MRAIAHPSGRPAEPLHHSVDRPRVVSDELCARVREMRAEGVSYPRIAEAFNAEGVPTAHGGRRWFAATVRKLAVA